MKKLLIALILVISASIVYALPGVPSLGLEVEGRIGAYVTTGPEEAKSALGNGFLAGGSLRYSIFPMFKVGISIDSVSLTEDALTYTTLPAGMKPLADLAADSFDVDYRLTPVCVEIMFAPPIIPIYAHAGMGIYTNSVTVTEKVSGENREIYSESESKFGTFIGVGVKFGLPMIPISFRAGARYHMLKGDENVTETINAVSMQLAIAVSF